MYMDGHVEFVRYQQKYPVTSPAPVNYGGKTNLDSVASVTMGLFGGQG